MTKIISKFLAVIMILNIISINNTELVFSEEDKSTSIELSAYRNGNIKESIERGQKGVEYNIDSLHIDHGKSYKLNKNSFNSSNFDQHIKIMVNGQTQDYINTDNDKLKFNFNYDEANGTLKVGIKEGQSNNTHMKPFILRKHSLYNIKIPAGLFIEENGTKSEEINYTFTTKGDGLYGKDIIRDISPSDVTTRIDYTKGEIIVDFIDEIYLNNDVYTNKKNYFEIRSSSITTPNVPNYNNTTVEDINKFDISINGNTLKLKSKSGKLNDFANYTVTLKSETVQLRDSRNLINGTIITNDTQNIVFSTDNWLDSVHLSTTDGWIPYNLPIGNIEDVPINPLIQIKFKYPVELIDKSKIKFSSDADDFSINLDKDSWINYDGDTLKLDINGMHRAGKNPLRKDTAYKITLGKGALKLKGYSDSQTKSQVENKEINIYFITGDWTTNADSWLYVTGYSSDDARTDNITNINNTKLDKNGEIYIHFNRNIQWNKWGTNVSSDAGALPYFKLYKKPSAYERDYTEKGVVFDKQFRFDKYQKIYTKDNIQEDEIPLEYVRLSGNKIKIKPKYELINLNEYRIELINKNIITDFHERTLIDNINQTIWTKGNGNPAKPDWELPDDIKAEEIIQDTNSPYKSYKIYGVPEYNEHIDKENGKPIIIYVDSEVILNPRKVNALGGINLYEGYTDSSNVAYVKGIEWYKIEYIGTGINTKTKISLYPNGTMDSGKYYGLKIPNNTFVTRNGEQFEYGAELRFVIRGDKVDSTGIYTVNMTNASSPLLISSFPRTGNPIKLNIKGYNFNEGISRIRFVRQRDGHTITLDSKYVKFKNVTELEAEINGNAALEFSKVANGGVYGIYIDFESGITATGGYVSGTTLIVKERPVRLRTDPGKTSGGQYIDEKDIYSIKTGTGKISYITIVFADIDGKLTLNRAKNEFKDIEIKVEGSSTNIVGTSDMITSSSNGEFTLRIPIEGELEENKKYEVKIPENLVEFTDVVTGGNLSYKWTFETSFTPSTTTPFKGSVPEDYDEKYPIILSGNNFQSRSDVYFVDSSGKEISAYSVDVEIDTTGDIAKVYLPRGRNKLKVGLYDIIIENDRNHNGYYKYGVLSVVPRGEFIPNEEFVQKSSDTKGNTIREGDVKKYIKTSNDTLELSSRYTDYAEVELDLDEIMGEEVWSRNISYRGYRSDTINRLITKSKWSDITLTNVTLDTNSSNRDIIVRLGRTPVAIEDNIKKKIAGKIVKSNFIEVSGENYTASMLKLNIPFKESNGKNLKLLRYDEQTRRITEIKLDDRNIDNVNKKVSIELVNETRGIFVVVE